MNAALEYARRVFALESCQLTPVPAHEGGRNIVFICSTPDGSRKVLRLSPAGDLDEASYIAETDFVRHLARNGAPVADVFPSINGRYVERCPLGDRAVFISLFAFAPGMLISDNGYRYREGAPLEEYFHNTGKALGRIHQLAKSMPACSRPQYFDKYNMDYINALIPDAYTALKAAIARRLEAFRTLPTGSSDYGLVHFDFSDGNYHIDMSNGQLTVFDFENCMYCWYMFDLANLWTHGVGWYRHEPDSARRMACMAHYFDTILGGYRSETEISDALVAQLPLFIDMVLIENIVDEFECCLRAGEELDYEDIGEAARCLIQDIPYAGFGAD